MRLRNTHAAATHTSITIIGIGCSTYRASGSQVIVYAMNPSVKAVGMDLPHEGSDLVATVASGTHRKMLIVPSVTMKGCSRRPVTSRPFSRPQPRPMASGTTMPTGMTCQAGAFSGKLWRTAAHPRADRPKIEPTEMSMPPEMMTNVTPMAMMAIHDIGVATLGRRLSIRRKLLTSWGWPFWTISTSGGTNVSRRPMRTMTTTSPASWR